MTQPRYSWERGNVIARCPDCDAVTNFEAKDGNAHYGVTIQNEQHEYQGKTYQRYVWKFLRCAGCGRGAVARVHDTNGQNRHLDVVDVFLPQAIEKAPLPEKVPQDLVKEFREAELCAAHGAYRAGSAMLRSVLEKALLKNGY